MLKDKCCNCGEEMVYEPVYVCAGCRLVMCEDCWTNNGGMCDKCYDKQYED